MIEFDPSLITPVDFNLDASLSTINILGEEYKVDLETYTKLMELGSDERRFFVKAKNRREKKYFQKKSIYQFRDYFVLWKEDLDNFYKKV